MWMSMNLAHFSSYPTILTCMTAIPKCGCKLPMSKSQLARWVGVQLILYFCPLCALYMLRMVRVHSFDHGCCDRHLSCHHQEIGNFTDRNVMYMVHNSNLSMRM